MHFDANTASGRSFIQRLRDAAHSVHAADREDPWTPTLRKIKGKVGQDGIERISTADTFDELAVPMRARPVADGPVVERHARARLEEHPGARA
jgi:hypothetical protein